MEDISRPAEFFGRTEFAYSGPRVTVSATSYDAQTTLPTHEHASPYVCVILDGAFSETAGRNEQIITGGSAVYHPAGEVHRDEFHQPSTCLNIQIPDAWLTDDPCIGRAAQRRVTMDARSILPLARQVRAEAARQDLAVGLAIEGLSMLLFSGVIRDHRPDPRAEPEWVTNIIERMREDPGSIRDIATLARAARMHPVSFSRSFRAAVGCSPSSFLRRCRVDRARALLRRTDLRLSDIALQVGFYDQAHFNRCFQSRFAMAPSAYRRRTAGRGEVDATD